MPYSALATIRKANIIEMTGWTPKELREQDAREIRMLEAVWGARGGSSRQERKMLK